MKRRSLKNTGIALSFFLPTSAFLILQLSGAWRLTATSSGEPMAEGLPTSRLIAEHPPVELVEKRDDHTRIWEIAREVETTHPDGSVTVETVKSYIHEKASGLRNKDATGNYVPSVAEWRETPEGFVIDRCPYGLAMGKTIGTAARYTVEGHDLLLRPAHLIVSDGVNQADLALLNPETPGFISPDNPCVLRFPCAFGEGYDLEYVAEKGGFHQNLIIANPPQLPAGFDSATAFIHLYTELNLDQYLLTSACQVTVEGEPVNASAADLVTEPSRNGSISFNKDGRLFHAFSVSQVTDSSGPGRLDKQTSAEKRLMKDPSSGKAYLVESVPFSYFADNSPMYPVTWDYMSKSGPLQQDEIWEPRNTYWLTGELQVAGATLTILPGTTVKLNPTPSWQAPSILIGQNAVIVAKGEPYNYITFANAGNDNSGEALPNPPSGPWGRAVEIDFESGDGSVIQYCKFGREGAAAIHVERTLAQPIAHNIFVFDEPESAWFADPIFANGAEGGGLDLIVHNNLIQTYGHGMYLGHVRDAIFTNNTIDGIIGGAPPNIRDGIYDHDHQGSFIATDNLFSKWRIGIFTDCPYPGNSHNRFFNVTTQVYGRQNDPDAQLDGSPYDPDCELGGFYLNEGDNEVWERLIDRGSRPASDAGFDDDVFTVFAPLTARGGVYNRGYTWYKGGGDQGLVDIGYHHNRIDRYVTGDITFSYGGWVAIRPGVVVAMAGQSFWIYTGGSLTCVGNPANEGYNLLTHRRAASMHIESPRFADNANPSLFVYSQARNDVEIMYTKIIWFMYGLNTSRTIPDGIRHNIFALNGFGGVSNGASNTLFNNLFYRNWFGVGAWDCDCECSNNTFDTNNGGIHWVRSANRTLTAKDNLFTGSTPDGIALYGPQTGGFLHDYNAFYGNQHKIYDYQAGAEVPIGQNSLDVALSPYDQNKAGWQATWFLRQAPDGPGDVLPIDHGSRSAIEAGLNQHTTAVAGTPDQGIVDIGFHHPIY